MHLSTRRICTYFGMVAMQQEASVCNCLAVRQAARHVTQLYDRHLAHVGLRATQYSILARLARLGPLSINELAALMVMDRTTTGRAIRPLQRDGLIAITPGRDERTRVVRLTQAGKKRVKAAAAHWRTAQQEFERAYGAGDAAKLRSALAQIVSAVPA